MMNAKEFLEAGQMLHGHKCPAMPLGLRAGAAAVNKLGVERAQDGQLQAPHVRLFGDEGEGDPGSGGASNQSSRVSMWHNHRFPLHPVRSSPV